MFEHDCTIGEFFTHVPLSPFTKQYHILSLLKMQAWSLYLQLFITYFKLQCQLLITPVSHFWPVAH